MSGTTLYLMLGYPGAGKTTVAQLIAKWTDAAHIWADLERHKMFSKPTHHEDESQKLYEFLNQRAEELLAKRRNVVFDTNFSYRRDRDLLRGMADRHGARTIVVWMTTPAPIARQRAVHAEVVRNGYEFSMTVAQFDQIAGHLETPGKDEKTIKLDGTQSNRKELAKLFRNQAT